MTVDLGAVLHARVVFVEDPGQSFGHGVAVGGRVRVADVHDDGVAVDVEFDGVGLVDPHLGAGGFVHRVVRGLPPAGGDAFEPQPVAVGLDDREEPVGQQPVLDQRVPELAGRDGGVAARVLDELGERPLADPFASAVGHPPVDLEREGADVAGDEVGDLADRVGLDAFAGRCGVVVEQWDAGVDEFDAVRCGPVVELASAFQDQAHSVSSGMACR